jgi:ubiquinone/menaquinone biosynthesis C-methylase UbiE
VTKNILGSSYVGAKAAKYDNVRTDKKKWKDEHDTIHLYMKDLKPGTSVLDIPVGTGRLLKFFEGKRFRVTGVDASDDMLALAGKIKVKNVTLKNADATKLDYKDKEFDAVVCVRLLHLVNEKTMQAIVKELTRVASSMMILTVQLGKEYYEGHDTATHVEPKFYALLKRLGWNVADKRKLTGAGWYVMRLDRGK